MKLWTYKSWGLVYTYTAGRYGGVFTIVQGVTATTPAQRITSRAMSLSECDSLQCEHARFGYALASIGDLDRDGYPG